MNIRQLSRLLCASAALLSASCATMLSPNQRQELETKVYAASIRDTFGAARDTIVNAGYQVNTSDFEGGMLTFQQEQLKYDAATAGSLSVLCPTVGDFYMQRYAWGIFDAFLWPFSIVWATASNIHIARTTYTDVKGTMAFESLREDSTRTRVTLSGVPWDAEKYPVVIRAIQEEIERQIFIKAGARPPDS